MKEKIKRKKRRNTIIVLYKKLMINMLMTLVIISMFAGSTYAWFTSTALTSGNKMRTGIMAIDLVMSKAELITKGKEENLNSYTPYNNRQIDATDDGVDNPEDYYVITGEDVSLIEIKNAEPGQIYPINIKIINSGQLAVRYTPSFEIQMDETDPENPKAMSYTGLETLKIEKELSDEKYPYEEHNYTNDGDLAAQGLLTYRDYEIRKRVLEREQIDHDSSSETYNTDIGGHLEDVLKVYIGTNELDIKDENYIGTIKEIINGEAISNYRGYLLPYSEIKDDLPGGKTVEISDGETILSTKNNVTEYGELNFLVKLPEDTNNLYEYASLVLKVGAKATQVEYEKDGLNIMIYDKDAAISTDPDV